MADEVRCIVDIRSGLGEGPVWSELEQALYWLDCVKPAVYRYEIASHYAVVKARNAERPFVNRDAEPAAQGDKVILGEWPFVPTDLQF